VPIRELVRYYLRLGLPGFVGPVALCGQMERELVQERRWLTKDEMREGIAVCQSLPGPHAIQVGIWISYIRGGFWGAWAGGWAFILPNVIIVAALDALYVHFGGLPWVTAIFYGVFPQGGLDDVRQRTRDRSVPREGSRATDRLAHRARVPRRRRHGHDQPGPRGHHRNLRRLSRCRTTRRLAP